jgi:hypothetical protein
MSPRRSLAYQIRAHLCLFLSSISFRDGLFEAHEGGVLTSAHACSWRCDLFSDCPLEVRDTAGQRTPTTRARPLSGRGWHETRREKMYSLRKLSVPSTAPPLGLGDHVKEDHRYRVEVDRITPG